MSAEKRKAGARMRAKGLLVVAVMAAAAGAGGLAHRLRERPVHHFGVVVPGALYRSGQPRGRQWRDLVRRYRIRTVIDLREDFPNAEWQNEELAFCAREGIRHVRLPIGPERISEERLRDILSIAADPACRPVLVHCEHGSSRTGVVVAAYRMVCCGWSLEAALAESYRYRRPMDPGYTSYLRQVAGGEGCVPVLALKDIGP